MAALIFVGTAMYNLTVPARASDEGVRIIIETTLRFDGATPPDRQFTYRVRWDNSERQTEYVTVFLRRQGNVWSGRNDIIVGYRGSNFTVTPVGGVVRYNDSPGSWRGRVTAASVTIRFSHTPAGDWERWDRWDDCVPWDRCGRSDCWNCGDRWNRDRLRWDDCVSWDRCGRWDCRTCGDRWDHDRNVVTLRNDPQPSASAPAPSRPTADSPVPNTAVNAMEDAARTARGGRAVITERNRTSITPNLLRSLHNEAQRHGSTAVLHADTLTENGRAVQGRLVVEPGRLTERTTDLLLGVYADPNLTRTVQQVFHNTFTNRVAVVRLEHRGDLGARMRVFALVDLAGLNTNNLRFYTYDRSNGRTAVLANPEYQISGQHLIFHTSQGGDIIITDRPLARR